MPVLPINQIDLWFVFDADVRTPGLLDAYRGLLTDEERARGQRFYFERHRRQFLITRALVRTVLSRYFPAVGPEDWRFSANDHGRPAISNNDEAATSVSFNLSHTDGLVLCGVSATPDLGVDIESVERRDTSFDVADRFFSRQEAAALRAGSPQRRRDGFFHYWTLKESYIKARGKGLSIPLDRFSFNPPDAADITISFHAGLEDSPANWRFWLLRPARTYLCAVCAQRLDGPPPTLRAHRIVPLESEMDFECPVLRRPR